MSSNHILSGMLDAYPYSNRNSDRNMKINIISVISIRIRSIFIHTCEIK